MNACRHALDLQILTVKLSARLSPGPEVVTLDALRLGAILLYNGFRYSVWSSGDLGLLYVTQVIRNTRLTGGEGSEAQTHSL